MSVIGVPIGALTVRGRTFEEAMQTATEIVRRIEPATAAAGLTVLGPAPAPFARLKGEHRFQLLIKSRSRKHLRELADAALKAAADCGVNLRSVNLEIDPVSIM